MDSPRVPDGLPLFEDTPVFGDEPLSPCCEEYVDGTLEHLMALDPDGSPSTPGARATANIQMDPCNVRVEPTEIDPESPQHTLEKSERAEEDTLERLLDLVPECPSPTGEDCAQRSGARPRLAGPIVVYDSDDDCGGDVSGQSQLLLRSGHTPPYSPTEVATSPYPSPPPSPTTLKFVSKLPPDFPFFSDDEQTPQAVFRFGSDGQPPTKRRRSMDRWAEEGETIPPSPYDPPDDPEAAERWQRRLSAPGIPQSSEAVAAISRY